MEERPEDPLPRGVVDERERRLVFAVGVYGFVVVYVVVVVVAGAAAGFEAVLVARFLGGRRDGEIVHEERRELARSVFAKRSGGRRGVRGSPLGRRCRPGDEEVVEAPRERVRVAVLQHDPAVPLAAVREMHELGQSVAREGPQRRRVAPSRSATSRPATDAVPVAPAPVVGGHGVEELDQPGPRGGLLLLGLLLAAVVVVLDEREPGESRGQLVRTRRGRRGGPVGSPIAILVGGGPPRLRRGSIARLSRAIGIGRSRDGQLEGPVESFGHAAVPIARPHGCRPLVGRLGECLPAGR